MVYTLRIAPYRLGCCTVSENSPAIPRDDDSRPCRCRIGCGEMAVEDEKKRIDGTLEIAYPLPNPADGRPLGWFRKVAGRAGEGSEDDQRGHRPGPRPPRGRTVCGPRRALADPGRTRRW